MSSTSQSGLRGYKRLIIIIPILFLLTSAVVIKTLESSHSRIQDLGNTLWPGYFTITMNEDPPTCDPNPAVATPTQDENNKEEGEPSTEEASEETQGPGEPKEEEEEEEEDDLGDFFDDDEEDDSEDDGSYSDEDDDLDDLLEVREATDEEKKQSAQAALALCQERHDKYNDAVSRLTPSVKAYRWVEIRVAELVAWGSTQTKPVLVFLLLLAAIAATARFEHIALRPARTKLDHRISAAGQLIACMLLAFSFYAQWQDELSAGIDAENSLPNSIFLLWIGGFCFMAAQNLWHAVQPQHTDQSKGSWAYALMTIPLFTVMALISGVYFLFGEGHSSGLAIHLNKLLDNSELYLAVGLYVLVGMLLKQTRLATLAFDIVRPFKLPAALLAVVVVAFAAFPTAYSGASGIFVIAAGGVIYSELIRSGADKQMALAATAMSGSLGVVLSPCLLVVIVAALNNEVTTTELFGWGWKVYLLSAVLFLLVVAVTRRSELRFTPQPHAMGSSAKGFLPLIPYVAIGLVVWAFYHYLIQTKLDEYTAPIILPVMLFFMLMYDRRKAQKTPVTDPETNQNPEQTPIGFTRAIGQATHETSGHIGALLMLMGLSVCLGGVVERGELMELVPQSFGSPESTMIVLIFVLVIIGMTMDPYGAVILVSASIADIAYNNGIAPAHFWMVVLCAFELGYLTPPVALNHLLARQVVGEEAYEFDEALENASFWRRHERILLPLTTMAIALMIVAFVPFFV